MPTYTSLSNKSYTLNGADLRVSVLPGNLYRVANSGSNTVTVSSSNGGDAVATLATIPAGKTQVFTATTGQFLIAGSRGTTFTLELVTLDASEQTVATSAATPTFRYPTRHPDFGRISARARRLQLISTADPTGGTFTITVAGVASANIAWNAAAEAYTGGNSVREKVQAALDDGSLTGVNAGWRVFVTGGTWPKVPYTLWFFNPNPFAAMPTVACDVSGLTGGTSVTVAITDPIIAQRTSTQGEALWGERLVKSGSTTLSDGSTNAVTVGNGAASAGTNAVSGTSTLLTSTSTSVAVSCIWNIEDQAGTDITYDIRDYPVIFEAFNPLGNVHAITASMSYNNNGTSTADCSFTASPGYQEWVCDGRKLPAGTTIDISALKSVKITTTSHTSGAYFDKDSKGKVEIGTIARTGRAGGRTTISLVFDDHLTTAFQTYRYIFRKYPHIPIGMALVKRWAQDGVRRSGTNLDAATVLTTAQVLELLAEPQFYGLTHTTEHYRYGTGVNPASTLTVARDQSIQHPYGYALTGGTFTLTIPGVGTTGSLNYNCTTKAVGNALVAVLGANSVEKVEFGSTAASTLGANQSIRVRFASPQPIMTYTGSSLTSATAGKNFLTVGPSYTVDEIAAAYIDNAAWWRSQGADCPNDIWIPPQGDISPALIEAANQNGVRFIRYADPIGQDSSFSGARFASQDCTFRCVPTRSIASSTTFSESFSGLMQSIAYAVHHGRHMCLMGHGVFPSSGGATDILATDLELLFSALSELEQSGAIALMTVPEQVSYLESVATAGV